MLCKDLENPYAAYARRMGGRFEGWECHPFGAFDEILAFHQMPLPEGAIEVAPLYPVPDGYKVFQWDKPAGKVLGNQIMVTSNVRLRPYVEAHEMGHVWNLIEGGPGKTFDELQACRRGAMFIPYGDRNTYWDIMDQYLRVLGVSRTWDGYTFSWPPDQLMALQFAWSVAHGYFKVATPMATQIK